MDERATRLVRVSQPEEKQRPVFDRLSIEGYIAEGSEEKDTHIMKR